MRNVSRIDQRAPTFFGQIRNVAGGAFSIGGAVLSELDGTPWHLKNTWVFQYFPNARESFSFDSLTTITSW